MNAEVVEALATLVKHITETGEWILNANDLKVMKPLVFFKKKRHFFFLILLFFLKKKTIKSYCKRSDDNVSTVFELIMTQLKKKHSQVKKKKVYTLFCLFK